MNFCAFQPHPVTGNIIVTHTSLVQLIPKIFDVFLMIVETLFKGCTFVNMNYCETNKQTTTTNNNNKNPIVSIHLSTTTTINIVIRSFFKIDHPITVIIQLQFNDDTNYNNWYRNQFKMLIQLL